MDEYGDDGVDQIAERLSLKGINALSNGVALGDTIATILGKETK